MPYVHITEDMTHLRTYAESGPLDEKKKRTAERQADSFIEKHFRKAYGCHMWTWCGENTPPDIREIASCVGAAHIIGQQFRIPDASIGEVDGEAYLLERAKALTAAILESSGYIPDGFGNVLEPVASEAPGSRLTVTVVR